MQPSRRPKDGRYGDNPNRLQHYYQYQVVLKPSPDDIQDLYLDSLQRARHRPAGERHPLRRGRLGVADARRLGPGLGSVAERHGSHAVHLLPAGRRPRLQAGARRDHLRPRAPGDVPAGQGQRLRPGLDADGVTYGDVYHQNEVEQSTYNFELATSRCCSSTSVNSRREAKRLIEAQLPLPGYEMVLKCSHTFNLLDARGAISVTERAAYIGRVRALRAPGRAGLLRFARARSASRCSSSRQEGCAEHGERDCKTPLLVELLTEELPPKALQALGEAFAQCGGSALGRGRLSSSSMSRAMHVLATPRRLAVHGARRARQGSRRTIERKGPMSQGPSMRRASRRKRCEGFAKKHGVAGRSAAETLDAERRVSSSAHGHSLGQTLDAVSCPA